MREKSAAAIPVRRAHREAFPVNRLDDLGGEDGVELLRVGVLVPEVAEHVSAPPHRVELCLFHPNISSTRVTCESGTNRTAPVTIRGCNLGTVRRLRSIFRITPPAALSSTFAYRRVTTEGEGLEP